MRLVAALACATVLAIVQVAGAQESMVEGTDVPGLLLADEVVYDQDKGIATARGNVEASQGGRILRAERLTYNERTDTVIASGNVVLLEPTGEVVFAEYVELTDAFKNGIVRGIRMLFSDDSRMAANAAVRSDGNRTVMNRAVYSPCELCPEDRSRPPLWQIKANRVIHNQSAKRVDYYDAFLEVFGVPVAYTPYFSHPDPTVDRKTGFLAPSYGSSSDLGFSLKVPYYIVLGPDKDMTLEPVFYTKEAAVFGAEYRQKFRQGELELSGSVTYPEARDSEGSLTSGREVRGHVFGSGRFDIDRTWRWGFDAERASDDTYLRRYGISGLDTLTSDLFIEGFRGRNYFAAWNYAFQGLREEDELGQTPFVWPAIEYSYVGEPSRLGARWEFTASALQLTRLDGTDSRRISLYGGWNLPYISPIGDIYSLTVDLRGDLYLVNDVSQSGDPAGQEFSGFTGRIRPRLAFGWRYPFVRESGTVRQVIEPVAQFVISPSGGNPDEIPNEDSTSFEFDDTNILSADRFPGYDRVEGGPRLNLALKGGVYGISGGSTEFLFGQTFRSAEDRDLPRNTGLETSRSDYVGRISIAPGPYFQLLHRFRLDRDDFGFRRNEIDLSVGPSWLRFAAGYVELSREETSETARTRREIRASLSWQIDPNWRLTAGWRRDLADDAGTIFYGAALNYEDECILLGVEARRDFIRDRDIEPSSSINFRIALRNLG